MAPMCATIPTGQRDGTGAGGGRDGRGAGEIGVGGGDKWCVCMSCMSDRDLKNEWEAINLV